MSEFILKLFVKDYRDTGNPSVRAACAVTAGWVCIACNILLSVSKFVIGLIRCSIAIQADAANNLSDVGSSAGMIFGAKAAAKPADREHPYGHARLEYIVSLAIAFLILTVGAALAKESIMKIIAPEPVDYSIAMLSVLVISMLVKLLMGSFTSNVGKLIGSAPMSAAAADSIIYVVATGAILVSSLLGYFFKINIDGWVSLAAAIFVLYSGVGIIKHTISPLLGAAPDKETVDELKRLLMSYDVIIGLHDILIHSYGPGKTIASAHAEVRADCDILATHEMIDMAEREVGEKLGMLLTLHMDPIEVDNDKLNLVKASIAKAIAGIDKRLMFHDFRMVSGEKNTNLIVDIVVPAGMSDAEADAVRDKIALAAKHIDQSYRCVITIDRDYLGIE